MKQLLVLSGKGGTGKTTVAASFIELSRVRAYADCDVDAPNLHLLARPATPPQIDPYYGLPKAVIDPQTCNNCGKCRAYCRFDAIDQTAGVYQVNNYACEGCALCSYVCPPKAITMTPFIDGRKELYRGERVFATAELKMGSGVSGLLVSEVKKALKANAEAPLAIIDGSPGIGCPVIASLNDVDMVLIVTEPSLSGMSDMRRIIKTARYFQTLIAVCINRYDVNIANADAIAEYCRAESIPLVGRIPYDENVVSATNANQTVIAYGGKAAEAIQAIYEKTMTVFRKSGADNDN